MRIGGLRRRLGRMFATTPTRCVASMAAAFALVAGAAQDSPVKELQAMPTPTPRPVR
jgi:hypothetical protein